MKRSKIKKPKRITKKKLKKLARTVHRKARKQWSLDVRERDGNACIICGRTDFPNAHHLIPKERFKQFELIVENGVTLCPTHHKFGAFSAHRHMVWFTLFLMINRPKQFSWVVRQLKHVPPGSYSLTKGAICPSSLSPQTFISLIELRTSIAGPSSRRSASRERL